MGSALATSNNLIMSLFCSTLKHSLPLPLSLAHHDWSRSTWPARASRPQGCTQLQPPQQLQPQLHAPMRSRAGHKDWARRPHTVVAAVAVIQCSEECVSLACGGLLSSSCEVPETVSNEVHGTVLRQVLAVKLSYAAPGHHIVSSTRITSALCSATTRLGR